MVVLWHTCSPLLHDDATLKAEVIALLENIHRPRFIDQPTSNPAMPVMIRSFRRLGVWRVFLVLTPWMFARMLIPDRDPGLAMSEGEDDPGKDVGREAPLLGPAVEFTLLGIRHKAHLNFDPQIGHYLLQPLILGMDRYANAEAAFAAWNNVITTRMAIAKRNKNHCEWQQEISRREVFPRLSSK